MTRKQKKEEKKRKQLPIDDQTTIADMNVEGFSWYDPNRKKNANGQPTKLSRKEYWAMVRGAFSAMLPLIGCMLVAGALIVALAILWLN